MGWCKEYEQSILLDKTKSFRELDGLKKLVSKFFLGPIFWQIQKIEAGVSHGKIVGVLSSLNRDRDTRHPRDRDPVTSSQIQQELSLVFLRQLVEDLPKIFDSIMISRISFFVFCSFLKNVPIIIFISNDQSHQLLGMEQLQNSSADNFQESFLE